MKKIIAMLLVLVMCFALVACETEDVSEQSTNTSLEEETPSIEEVLIGKWTCPRAAGQDNVTEASVYTIELYKGGSFYLYNYVEESGDKYNNLSGTWEVNDDILTITLPKASQGYVIDIANEPYSLTKQIDNTVVLHKEGN